ncbi:hypothetical protein IAT38_001884 [Cryptococcus sp. DSM 104549]
MATTTAGPSKPRAKPLPVPVGPFENPADDEERTVHAVYEAIAPHFAQTRFKPWPLISTFLSSLPPNSLGLDSGAGNGKYLPVARDAGSEMIALDRSAGLLSVAREGGGECVRGDLGFAGWRRGVFDFAISVAAIHHLSTPERRRHSVQVLIRPLKLSLKPPFSRFMIYVWAYEQGEASRRKMGTAASAAGQPTDAGATDTGKLENQKEASEKEKVQDVLVPWVLAPKKGETSRKPKPNPKTRRVRGGAPPAEPEVPPPAEPEVPQSEPQVYHRYYHLFVQGELQQMVEEAGREEGFEVLANDAEPTPGTRWLRSKGVGWEADNWWLEGEVGGEET